MIDDRMIKGFNTNIDEPKLIYNIDTIKIGEGATIKIDFYEKRGTRFYDIVLNLKDKEIFIGRFNKGEETIKAKYNDGKIIICDERLIEGENKVGIMKVFSLYDILDDTFYSCTEEEALNIFDSSIDTSHLKDKNKPIYRADIEKKRRL